MPKLPTRYLLTGPVDAPCITFSHPIGSSSAIWTAHIAAFGDRYRVLTYDIRGHGQSGLPPGPCTVDTLADDVLQLWNELGIERSHFVGLSLGGCIGVALARRAPSRVDSLSIACARLDMDEAAARMWQDRARQVETGGLEPLVDGTLERWLSAEFMERDPAAAERIRNILRQTSASGFAACARVLGAMQLAGELARLRQPVMYLAGTVDKAIVATEIRRYHALTPGSRLVELEGPHLLNVENPSAFNTALHAFLDSLP